MMILSLVKMAGLEKCCIISACLRWLFHSGEQAVAHGPLVVFFFYFVLFLCPGLSNAAVGHIVFRYVAFIHGYVMFVTRV